MDNMSLREKLDAIEACEKLIVFYGNKLKSWDHKYSAARRDAIDEDELENIGLEEAAPARAKYDYYRGLRRDLMAALEMDPLLNVIDKARMI